MFDNMHGYRQDFDHHNKQKLHNMGKLFIEVNPSLYAGLWKLSLKAGVLTAGLMKWIITLALKFGVIHGTEGSGNTEIVDEMVQN